MILCQLKLPYSSPEALDITVRLSGKVQRWIAGLRCYLLVHPLLTLSSFQTQVVMLRRRHAPHTGFTPSHLRFLSRHSSQASGVRRRLRAPSGSGDPAVDLGDICDTIGLLLRHLVDGRETN